MTTYSLAAVSLVLLCCVVYTCGAPQRTRLSAQPDAANTRQRSLSSKHVEGKRSTKARDTGVTEKGLRSLLKSVLTQRSVDRRDPMETRQVQDEPGQTRSSSLRANAISPQYRKSAPSKRILDVVLGQECGAFGCDTSSDPGDFNYGTPDDDYYDNYGSPNNDPEPVGYWEDCVDVPGMECYYYYEGYYGDDYRY